MSQAINPFAAHPDRLALTDAEVLAWLLEEVEQVDTTPVTLLVLEKSLTAEEYGNVLVSLHYGQIPEDATPAAIGAATRVRGLFNALSVGGLALHEEYHQQQLSVLGTAFGWPAELTQKIQRISRPLMSRWQIEGLAAEPTPESIANCRKEVAEAAAKEAFEKRAQNASALFLERIKFGEDPATVFSTAWEDAI